MKAKKTPHVHLFHALCKGVFISVIILVFSFSIALLAHAIKKHEEFIAKKNAFLHAGIDVIFEEQRVHIAPIKSDIFDDEAKKQLQLPLLEAQSAQLTFTKGAYRITPEIIGQELDISKLHSNLAGRMKTFSKVPITAEIKQIQPEITTGQFHQALPELRKKFEHVVALTSEEFNPTVRLRDHLNWIVFSVTENELTFTIAPDSFKAFAQQNWSSKVDRKPTEMMIAHDEKGKITFSDKAKNGQHLNLDELLGRYKEALKNNSKKIELPIEEEKFTLDIAADLKSLGVKEVVSIGHTSYYRSPQNRIHNINVGLTKFNGALIAPGETFSFLKQLGPVDGVNGFLKELVIKPEGTIPDFGGGLCQVSTTAYRAALYAGLPIVERSPHSYAVSYYSQIGGHGIDATIYPGAHDLRFTNDTPGHILIQAYDDGPEAFFIFYGTNDGRKVKLEGPIISNRHSQTGTDYIKSTEVPAGTIRQTKHAQAGFSTLWYRYLTLSDGLTHKEEIRSIYVAIKDEFLVGVTREDLADKTKDGKAIADTIKKPKD